MFFITPQWEDINTYVLQDTKRIKKIWKCYKNTKYSEQFFTLVLMKAS